MALVLVTGSCGGGATGPGPLATITISGAGNLDLGHRVRYAATTLDAKGRTLTGHRLTWSVSDTTVATIDSTTGDLRTQRAGAVVVTVQSAGLQGARALQVRDAALTRLDLLTPNGPMIIGATAQASVAAHTAHGGPVAAGPAVWSSSNGTIATVDAAGLLTAVGEGMATIMVVSGELTAMRALIVMPLPVATLAIAGPSGPSGLDEILDDGVVQLSATALAADGTVLEGRHISWSSSRPTVATVDETGLVTAVESGTSQITAISGGVRATHDVVVQQRPYGAIAALGGPLTLQAGGQVRLRVRPIKQNGDTLSVRTGSFQSSNPAVARVTMFGEVTAVSLGVATITARIGSDPAVAQWEVTVEPPGTSSYPITVHYLQAPTAELEAIVTKAVARWQRVIMGPNVSRTISLPPGACFEGSPAINETVSGARIFVAFDSIDGRGGTVGMAGPCVLNENGLTSLGIVVLDREDMAILAALPTLAGENVIAHELGHVFGIGTVWNGIYSIPDLIVGRGTDDPRYNGAHGRAAHHALGFTEDVRTNVPVENLGGPGTSGAHWRMSALSGELLVGWVSHSFMALSYVTVGALRDFGYVVAPSGAEYFMSPMSTTMRTAARADIRLQSDGVAPTEVLLRPRYQMGHDGRTRRLP